MKQIVKDEIIQALRTRSGILTAEHVHLQRRLAESAGVMGRTERHQLRQEYTSLSDALRVNEWAMLEAVQWTIDTAPEASTAATEKVSIMDIHKAGGTTGATDSQSEIADRRMALGKLDGRCFQ